MDDEEIIEKVLATPFEVERRGYAKVAEPHGNTITRKRVLTMMQQARADENECLSCGKHNAVCCADCYSTDIRQARASERVVFSEKAAAKRESD
jgi:hypothetical protein